MPRGSDMGDGRRRSAMYFARFECGYLQTDQSDRQAGDDMRISLSQVVADEFFCGSRSQNMSNVL